MASSGSRSGQPRQPQAGVVAPPRRPHLVGLFKVLPDERTNSIIAAGGPLQMKQIREIVAKLDIRSPDAMAAYPRLSAQERRGPRNDIGACGLLGGGGGRPAFRRRPAKARSDAVAVLAADEFRLRRRILVAADGGGFGGGSIGGRLRRRFGGSSMMGGGMMGGSSDAEMGGGGRRSGGMGTSGGHGAGAGTASGVAADIPRNSPTKSTLPRILLPILWSSARRRRTMRPFAASSRNSMCRVFRFSCRPSSSRSAPSGSAISGSASMLHPHSRTALWASERLTSANFKLRWAILGTDRTWARARVRQPVFDPYGGCRGGWRNDHCHAIDSSVRCRADHGARIGYPFQCALGADPADRR